MRLIDADVMKDITCELCRYCLEDSKGNKDFDGCREMGCGVMDMIDSASTIEAIRVERLARVFGTSHLEEPCHYKFGIIKHQSDQFCFKCIEHDSEECWLHAFKEGWLDE